MRQVSVSNKKCCAAIAIEVSHKCQRLLNKASSAPRYHALVIFAAKTRRL